jgi:hypothetical protein
VVDDRLSHAVQNSARWCDLVCHSVGIATQMRRSVWVALRRSPPLYPDAITLSPHVTADEVAQAIVAGRGCSVKDSFADLDLEKHGFEVFFEGRWIYRPSADPTATTSASWGVIQSDTELTDWSLAAGDDVAVPSAALRDPTVRVLAAKGPNGITAGAIANQTGSVVGVSNVFGSGAADPATWKDIGVAIASAFRSLPLVGYEQGDSLQAALSSGFEEIGALRIWLFTNPSHGLPAAQVRPTDR